MVLSRSAEVMGRNAKRSGRRGGHQGGNGSSKRMDTRRGCPSSLPLRPSPNKLPCVIRRMVHGVFRPAHGVLRAALHRGVEHCARRQHGGHCARDQAGRRARNKWRYTHCFSPPFFKTQLDACAFSMPRGAPKPASAHPHKICRKKQFYFAQSTVYKCGCIQYNTR